MFSTLKSWLKPTTTLRPSVPTRLGLTALEAREVPAGMTIDGSVLRFEGYTGMENYITVLRPSDNGPGVMVNMRTPTGAIQQRVIAPVNSIVMIGQERNDYLEASTTLPLTAYGNGGHDIIVGGSNIDQLFGGEGNDLLNGMSGNDLLSGLNGNDSLFGGRGNDLIGGGNGIDRLYGQEGNDTLLYNIDTYWDLVYTSDVSGKSRSYDLFDGGADDDTLTMPGSDDVLFLDDTSSRDAPRRRLVAVEKIDAGSGNDYVNLATYDSGSPFNLGTDRVEVNGSSGADVLIGNRLTRTDLNGDSGNDTLIAGSRADRLSGASDADTAIVFAGQASVSRCESVRITVQTDQLQDDEWSCGPNSVSRLLRAYGLDASYSQVRSDARYGGSLISWMKLGTSTGQLLDTLQNWKPDARREEESNTDRLVELIRQGKPAVVLLSMGSDRHTIWNPFGENFYIGRTAAMHYLVINGYDAATDSFAYTDTNGTQGTWTRAEFDRRWNWHNDFSGAFGETAQEGLAALAFRKRTVFY